jgi:hypothetical protein
MRQHTAQCTSESRTAPTHLSIPCPALSHDMLHLQCSRLIPRRPQVAPELSQILLQLAHLLLQRLTLTEASLQRRPGFPPGGLRGCQVGLEAATALPSLHQLLLQGGQP